jgi:hypothetical protein
MEFADRGIAGLEHLDIEMARNGFLVFGLQSLGKAVHQLAPAPE